MEKVYTGKDHSIYQLNKNTNGLVEQMLPMQCVKAFKRGGNKEKVDPYNMGWWDCDCGIYVIGSIEHVEKSFDILYGWMQLRTDREIINDLAENDALDYLAIFKSIEQDIAIIIGGGYYEETNEDFLTILNGLKKVSVGEIGANYSNDQNLYRTLLEDIDYIDYQKEYQNQKKEKINPIHIAIISEVFEYWEKNNIYTKADRVKDDLINVDKVIETYSESHHHK